MRSLLAALLSWLMPSTGKRRSTPPAPTQHPLTDEPTQTLGVVRPAPSTPHSPRPADLIVADGSPLVRPYVIQHEQERECQRQRDRRTALTLATIGIDFHGATV